MMKLTDLCHVSLSSNSKHTDDNTVISFIKYFGITKCLIVLNSSRMEALIHTHSI